MGEKKRLTMQPPLIRNMAPPIARIPPKVVDSFYSSPEWRALMSRILKERGRGCEDRSCSAPHAPGVRYGDHIREIRDGGAKLDPRNVMVMCATCHGRKTARARAARMARNPV